MTKKEMKEKALEALDGRVENIFTVDAFSEYVEVLGTTGGDALRYRIYFNGNKVDRISCK